MTEFLFNIETLPRAAKVLTLSLAPGPSRHLLDGADLERDRHDGAVHERHERRAGVGAGADRGCGGTGSTG